MLLLDSLLGISPLYQKNCLYSTLKLVRQLRQTTTSELRQAALGMVHTFVKTMMKNRRSSENMVLYRNLTKITPCFLRNPDMHRFSNSKRRTTEVGQTD